MRQVFVTLLAAYLLAACQSLGVYDAASVAGLLPSPPDHAHSTRDGWQCDAGYFPSGNTCEQLRAPANARINEAGTAWICELGYLPGRSTNFASFNYNTDDFIRKPNETIGACWRVPEVEVSRAEMLDITLKVQISAVEFE